MFSRGDRVAVLFDESPYLGQIVELKNRGPKMKFAVVSFDDGEEHELPISELLDPEAYEAAIEEAVAEAEDEDRQARVYKPKGQEGGGSGFHLYPVAWNKDHSGFKCEVTLDDTDLGLSEATDRLLGQTLEFHGAWVRTQCWRVHGTKRTPVICWDLDIYGRLKHDPSCTYYVKCIHYDEMAYDLDTVREDIDERNKDICFAIREWLWREIVPRGVNLQDLEKRAMRPIIRAPSLDWLDRTIYKLQEARAIACRLGGERGVIIETGDPDSPRVSIVLNFTDIAIATDGKPPPSMMGSVITEAGSGKRRKGDEPRLRPQTIKADPENVEALKKMLVELNKAAKSGDANAKSEARKIRSTLRNLGIKGGARQAEAATA